MICNEMQMDDNVQEIRSNLADGGEPDEQQPVNEEIAMLRIDFQVSPDNGKLENRGCSRRHDRS